MKKLYILIIALTFSQLCFSTVKWTSSKYEINNIQLVGNGNFVIYMTESVDPVCQGGGKLFYVYDDVDKNIGNGIDSDGLKALFSLSITAMIAGKKIEVQYDNSSSACFVQAINIYN